MRRLMALLGVLGLCAACGGDQLAQPTPAASVASSCQALMSALPSKLVGRDRTSLEGNVATWGDPRISLRCGVARPDAMAPTSRCDEVNGVGWFAEDPGTAVKGAWRFTTLGRSGYVEVVVPEAYQPAGDVLVELADAVKKMPLVTPCV